MTEVTDDQFTLSLPNCTCLPELPCRLDVGIETYWITQEESTQEGSLPYCASYTYNMTRFFDDVVVDTFTVHFNGECSIYFLKNDICIYSQYNIEREHHRA